MTGPTRPLCVLVGAPGSGKTTVGLALAEVFGVEFRDTDADIERRAGKPIPEIFLDEGEAHFRTLEWAAVSAALASCSGVLALGGGAVLAEENRAALAGHRVVHLSVELPDAVKRVGLGAGRPLLAINPRATLKHLMDQRRPLYAEVATATVVTDGRTPEEIAAEIAQLLRKDG
ncbi:shikimate kinase [Micromonospora sp. CA-263727]|uniref:shikimate kinase n=1 Tax=Micromonospora sp. CA-263727 TaxID=3239967 RepID=UPI003D8F5BF3